MAAVGAIAAAGAETVRLDGVVAVVGSSAILRSEVETYARELSAQRPPAQASIPGGEEVNLIEGLEGLLTQKLLFQQALVDSVEINADDVAQRAQQHLQGLIDQAGGITQLEKMQHMPVFSVREMLRQRYEEQAYAQSMQMTVVGDLRVTPGEVERYYRDMDKNNLPIIPVQYVYAHITKFPSTMKEAKERTRTQLLEMRERAIKGEARFDVLARMYSMHPSALRGGEVEPQPLSAFEPAFGDALSEMKTGQISEVIENRDGYNLLQLVDVRGRMFHVRRILLRPVFAPEELAVAGRTLDSLADLIRKDSITFEAAALKYSDDTHSKMNGGVVTNHDLLEVLGSGYQNARYTETRFFREDFGQGGSKSLADWNQLQVLQPGEVSEAYLTEDILGNQLSKIVKLVRVVPEHPASLDQDYIRIEQLALNAKQEKVFMEWLDEKIRSMYIYIDPEFRDGEFLNKHWVK